MEIHSAMRMNTTTWMNVPMGNVEQKQVTQKKRKSGKTIYRQGWDDWKQALIPSTQGWGRKLQGKPS